MSAPRSHLPSPHGERALGLFHVVTGIWLMYLAFAAAVNFSLKYHWWL